MMKVVFVALFALSLPANAASIESLVVHPTLNDVKISPDGKHLAIRVFSDGHYSLRFLERATRKQVGGMALRSSDVGEIYWVNNERVVFTVLASEPGGDFPVSYGELFATNIDGSGSEAIFGYRSGQKQVGSLIKKRDADFEWADVIDVLPENPRQILISSTPMTDSWKRQPRAHLLNVYSGIEGNNLKMAKYGVATFMTDTHGDIRLVESLSPEGNIHLEALAPDSEDWSDLPETLYGNQVRPIALSDDSAWVYVLDYRQEDKQGLYKLALDGSEDKHIYTHKRVDITDVVMSTDGRSVYAMRVDDGYPSYLIFSGSNPEAVAFKRLLTTFPGNLLNIVDRSADNRFWVIKVASDTNEGRYYLFDQEKDVVESLYDLRPDVDENELASMEPISFESFDGRSVAGYFTAAKAKGDSVPPLIVLVHGGPQMRDMWEYNSTVQVLATRGYSVLQVNYRGSTGYGREFGADGQREWGRNVQRDIISGTRWAISEGRATSGNICIMGVSFGAYSAVQSAILEPDLFQCVVANAGIYDLSLLYSTGDIEEKYWGEEYLRSQVGNDPEELARFSPVNRVEALKAPVFIAHGKKDARAPFEHAKALKKALDRNGKDYEWLVLGKEGHGFYQDENQLEYLTKALKFLGKHLRVP